MRRLDEARVPALAIRRVEEAALGLLGRSSDAGAS